MADAAEARAAAARAAARADLVSTWNVQRDVTLRQPTWSLNDPAEIRKDRLPRSVQPLYVTHEPIHASNAQVFECEVLEDPAIRKAAQAATVTALTAQTAAAAEALRQQREAEHAHETISEAARVLADAHAAETAAHAAATRRSVRASNESLAGTRHEVAVVAASTERALDDATVAFQRANPFLREDTRTGS